MRIVFTSIDQPVPPTVLPSWSGWGITFPMNCRGKIIPFPPLRHFEIFERHSHGINLCDSIWAKFVGGYDLSGRTCRTSPEGSVCQRSVNFSYCVGTPKSRLRTKTHLYCLPDDTQEILERRQRSAPFLARSRRRILLHYPLQTSRMRACPW
jgi:hypothetical protein